MIAAVVVCVMPFVLLMALYGIANLLLWIESHIEE